MPRHSLFPNSITLHYTSNGHQHNQVLPVGVVSGSAPAWTLPVRTGSPVDWRTAMDDYAVLIADAFGAEASLDYAELFTYEATNSPAEFLAAHVIDVAGSGGGAGTDFVQTVMPFKALGGNSLRLTLIENGIAPNVHVPAAGAAAAYAAIIDFVLGDDDWIVTRGGSFPLVSLGLTSKVNDKLRKRYLLDA